MVCNLADVVITAGNTERYVLTKDRPPPLREDAIAQPELFDVLVEVEASFSWTRGALAACGWLGAIPDLPLGVRSTLPHGRSEERRGGEAGCRRCRCWVSPVH